MGIRIIRCRSLDHASAAGRYVCAAGATDIAAPRDRWNGSGDSIAACSARGRAGQGRGMTGPMLKLLIVDDEEPARQRLRDLLAREEGVGPLLEAGDGESAAAMIL